MDERQNPGMNRRELLSAMGKAAVWTLVLPPVLQEGLAGATVSGAGAVGAADPPLSVMAGPDRVAVTSGAAAQTYLNGWVGYGEPWWHRVPWHQAKAAPSGPPPTVRWSKESGPGEVTFGDANALVTTATFSQPGEYVLRLEGDNGTEKVSSTFRVTTEAPPPPEPLEAVGLQRYRIDSKLWNRTSKALIVNWLPHCVAQLERTDLKEGEGGLDNFVEAAKALRGEPHGPHKGYVFANAFVHNTVEALCTAQLVDAQGDKEIEAAQAAMRATLDRWIPIILAAQHPDGYLQTAYTLRDTSKWHERWTEEGRGNHEGYTGGYFIESAIAHHVATGGKDRRLYDAARKLADCWDAHIGPSPKQEWWDDHEAMEMALIHLGQHVDALEGKGQGERYFRLAKFLLECRRGGFEYDQAQAPVVQQYEAVGHAVRGPYLYSAMTDVAAVTRDPAYLSAIRSISDDISHRKFYVTGGVGSDPAYEGFGTAYELRNNGYCESCSSCGQMFFQSRMSRLYQDASYMDLFEETMYNALLGSTDLEAKHYYYDNPLDANVPRYLWHNCPCCVGNIPRTLLSLPNWIYARGKDGLYVNLFVGSAVTLDVAGTAVELVQRTEYPWQGKVRITVSPKSATTFALRVRSPGRAASKLYQATPSADGITRLAVNGKAVQPHIEHGYAVIERTWHPGDIVDLELPLRVQRVRADARVKAVAGRVALKYGPLIYNIEQQDQDIGKALSDNAALKPEWRGNFLGGVTVIRGQFADGTPLLAIPNFVRDNRGVTPTEYPKEPERPADGSRPKPFPATSIIWIKEA